MNQSELDNKTEVKEMNTEEKILAAAAEVFTRKGYAATKTRDIAELAGINIASLHYYYRSKEKLFEIIASEALRKMSNQIDSILNSSRPLHEKVYEFVPAYIDFLKANPYIPMFIFSESEKNPEKIMHQMSHQKTLEVLRAQLEELEEAGKIRPMNIGNFMSNLIGLIVFPFMGKALMMRKAEMTPEEYDIMLEERKQLIPEMIINYLYYEMPE